MPSGRCAATQGRFSKTKCNVSGTATDALQRQRKSSSQCAVWCAQSSTNQLFAHVKPLPTVHSKNTRQRSPQSSASTSTNLPHNARTVVLNLALKHSTLQRFVNGLPSLPLYGNVESSILNGVLHAKEQTLGKSHDQGTTSRPTY